MVPMFRNDYDKPNLLLPLNELILDRATFVADENYKKILKEEEDVDLETPPNPGGFMMKPDFNIIFL